MRKRLGLVLIGALIVGCNNAPAPADAPPPTDTNTADDPVVLPIDTSVFIPNDTAGDQIPDLIPDNWVYMAQRVTWDVAGNDMTGTLQIREYIDVLDTASANPYLCDVAYNLTGQASGNNTCSSCDLVFDIEHFVTLGNPGDCSDPDAPTDGALWQMGYDSGQNMILLNYFGTDVWLPWYDTTSGPPAVVGDWSATLAIEVPDTMDMN